MMSGSVSVETKKPVIMTKMTLDFLVTPSFDDSPAISDVSDQTNSESTLTFSELKNSCTECHESFSFKASLLFHMAQKHGAEGIICCTQCSLGFKRKSDQRKHNLTVHERYRPFACGSCKASFYLKKDLVKHDSSVHQKLKPFICNVCGSKFGKKEHMTRHVRSVHEKKPRS
uniref:C2H2-type domain-containing protein n=1 Tax=Rhodosorus marinus TaxID=101924 RepID=A0A7S3A091_9RHOD|mmetsp:Transcript_3971/g.16835  ORF Transcript_3971/g.16835 Transcript_3971/m.16835 type:complete len:172 (+) Transcript_3971:239-754(+)